MYPESPRPSRIGSPAVDGLLRRWRASTHFPLLRCCGVVFGVVHRLFFQACISLHPLLQKKHTTTTKRRTRERGEVEEHQEHNNTLAAPQSSTAHTTEEVPQTKRRKKAYRTRSAVAPQLRATAVVSDGDRGSVFVRDRCSSSLPPPPKKCCRTTTKETEKKGKMKCAEKETCVGRVQSRAAVQGLPECDRVVPLQ